MTITTNNGLVLITEGNKVIETNPNVDSIVNRIIENFDTLKLEGKVYLEATFTYPPSIIKGLIIELKA